jgi:hypothetical protein
VNLLISDEFKDRDSEDGQQLRKFQLEAMLDPTAEVTAAEQEKSRTATVEVK